MLNFKLLNDAMNTLKSHGDAFMLLYFIANNKSIQETNEMTTYIPALMKHFGWSRSKVQRTIKTLVDEGLIVREYQKGESNRKPITIKVMVKNDNDFSKTDGQNCSKVMVKNDLLKKTSIKNNMIKKGPDYQGPGTREKVMVKNDNDFNKSDGQNCSKVMVKNDLLKKTSIKNNMIKKGPDYQGPGTREKMKSKNDIVNEYKDRMNDRIRHLKSIRNQMIYNDVLSSIRKQFEWAEEHRDYFSESQYNSFVTGYRSSVEKIVKGKEAYFNGTSPSEDETISVEEKKRPDDLQPSETVKSQSEGKLKTVDFKKVYAWLHDSLQRHSEYSTWEKEFDRLLNRKYRTSDWVSLCDTDMESFNQASLISRKCESIACNYFNKQSEMGGVAEVKENDEENTGTDPWDVLNETWSGRPSR